MTDTDMQDDTLRWCKMKLVEAALITVDVYEIVADAAAADAAAAAAAVDRHNILEVIETDFDFENLIGNKRYYQYNKEWVDLFDSCCRMAFDFESDMNTFEMKLESDSLKVEVKAISLQLTVGVADYDETVD